LPEENNEEQIEVLNTSSARDVQVPERMSDFFTCDVPAGGDSQWRDCYPVLARSNVARASRVERE